MNLFDGLRKRATAILMGSLLCSTSPLLAADAPPRGTVKVDYANAKEFTDVGDERRQPTDAERDAILKQLTTFIEQRAGARVPQGSTLAITVTDIDRAGEFEVWRGPQADHIRVFKPVYSPRIKLTFSLVDANGGKIAGGDRDLRDLDYLTGIIDDRQDPLRYEKRMLNRWIQREFHP
jgi:Protein of unknown function (DUF3016)